MAHFHSYFTWHIRLFFLRGQSWWRWLTSGDDINHLPWTSGQPDGSGRCLWMWKKHDYRLDDFQCNLIDDAVPMCQAFPLDRGK